MKARVGDIIKKIRKREANIRGYQTRKLRKEYGAWDVYLLTMGIIIGLLMYHLVAVWSGIL